MSALFSESPVKRNKSSHGQHLGYSLAKTLEVKHIVTRKPRDLEESGKKMEGVDILSGRLIHDDTSDMAAPYVIQLIILDGQYGRHAGELGRGMAGTQVTDVWHTDITVQTVPANIA